MLIKLLKTIFYIIIFLACVAYTVESFLIQTHLVRGIRNYIPPESVNIYITVVFLITIFSLYYTSNIETETEKHMKISTIIIIIFTYINMIFLFISGALYLLIYHGRLINKICTETHSTTITQCFLINPMFTIELISVICLLIIVVITYFISIRKIQYPIIYNSIKDYKNKYIEDNIPNEKLLSVNTIPSNKKSGTKLNKQIRAWGIMCLIPNITLWNEVFLKSYTTHLHPFGVPPRIDFELKHPYLRLSVYTVWLLGMLIYPVYKHFKNKIIDTIKNSNDNSNVNNNCIH